MANLFRLRQPSALLIGLLFSVFYCLSYTPLVHPNFAWLTQALGLIGFLLWVKDEPNHWYLLHGPSFLTLYWLFFPLHYFVGLPWVIALFLVLFLIIVLTFFKSVPMSCLTKHYPVHGILASACYWALFEYAQIHMLKFPWILWSQLQGPSPLMPLLSLFHYSLWVIIFVAMSLQILKSRWHMNLLYLALILFLVPFYPPSQSEPELKIGVIQGHINKREPSRQPYLIRYQFHEDYLQTYVDLTQKLNEVDLIVWPECIMGSVFPRELRHLDDYRSRIAFSAPLILGASLSDPGHENIAMVIWPNGNKTYRVKKHYVPFAESTPTIFIPLLSKLIPDFYFESHIASQHYEAFVLQLRNQLFKVLTIICYESAFLSYETIPEVDWIIVISENIWFQSTTAQYQQLAFAQLIARVHKKPVILASNNGLTGWVSANGFLQQSALNNVSTTLTIDWGNSKH